MAIGGRGVGDVIVDQAAIDALVSGPAGAVAAFVADIAQQTAQEAKRLAPVGARNSRSNNGHPSGYLRSEIGWEIGVDGGDIVVDIASPALTSPANPYPGEPYGLHNEVPSTRPRPLPAALGGAGKPHLVPALETVIGRIG